MSRQIPSARACALVIEALCARAREAIEEGTDSGLSTYRLAARTGLSESTVRRVVYYGFSRGVLRKGFVRDTYRTLKGDRIQRTTRARPVWGLLQYTLPDHEI